MEQKETNIISFPITPESCPHLFPLLPEFETALGHLVIAGKISAVEAYNSIGLSFERIPPEDVA